MPVAVIDAAGSATPVLFHVHADHLHRPLRMTAAAGPDVLWRAEWLPWGEPVPGSPTSSPSLGMRFPGQWFQLESGLHYNWHRHYDPTLGRYTQPDPLGFVDGPSVYGYARGNPVAAVDPEGLNVLRVLKELCLKFPQACSRPVVYLCGAKGLLNSNSYLRIGRSWHKKDKQAYFSVRGKLVDKITGESGKHIDLFKWTLD